MDAVPAVLEFSKRVPDCSRLGTIGLFGGTGGGNPRPVFPAFVNDLLILFATVATLVICNIGVDELFDPVGCTCCDCCCSCA